MPLTSQHCIETPNRPEVEGETRPIRHALAKKRFITKYTETITTLYENFLRSMRAYGDLEFMGVRKFDQDPKGPYVFQTYVQVAERVKFLTSAMHLFKLKEKTKVGIYSINKPEWVIAEMACFTVSYVTVSIGEGTSIDNLKFILNQTEMELIFVSNNKLPTLLSIAAEIPLLKRIILMDSNTPAKEDVEKAKSKGLKVALMADLETKGRKLKLKPFPPVPEDLCTIIYTTSTNGTPKGVMLTHAALLSSISSALAMLNMTQNGACTPLFQFDVAREVHLSYLPLSHIYERFVCHTCITAGAKIGFYQGDMSKVVDDMNELQPTLLIAVPKQLNRLYDKAWTEIRAKGGIAEFAFNSAYKSKLASLQKSGTLEHGIRMIFGKIRRAYGGRVKAILSGAAPLKPEVSEFLRIAFSCPVIEGFGMAETSAFSVVSVPGDHFNGNMGIPTPCTELKLVDVPEMGYAVTDLPNPRGQIWIRGPSCFTGYYKDSRHTKEFLTWDGWVMTGDIGEMDEAGRLRIIDRKKGTFKLSQGEYVSPERVERIIEKSPWVTQAFVDGRSICSFPVAIIVPDVESLNSWATLKGISTEEAISDNHYRDRILQEIEYMGPHGKGELQSYEVPMAIHVEPNRFTVHNSLLDKTTLQIRRDIARQKYGGIIQKLYGRNR